MNLLSPFEMSTATFQNVRNTELFSRAVLAYAILRLPWWQRPTARLKLYFSTRRNVKVMMRKIARGEVALVGRDRLVPMPEEDEGGETLPN